MSSRASTAPEHRSESPQTPLRLLFVVPFAPRLDSRHGGKVIAQLLNGLAGGHELAVVYLSDPSGPSIDPELAARCALVKRIDAPRQGPMRAWQHRFNVLLSALIRRPTAVGAVHSRRFARTVREVAYDWRPDVIQVEHDLIAYCAAGLTDSGAALVLVCHDPGLKASEDMIRTTRGRQRLAHQLDLRSWRIYWRRRFPDFDAVIVFTPEDIQSLKGFADSTPVVRIPLSVEIPPGGPAVTGSGDQSVMFVGGFSHLPNADAALRLIREIMPLARRSTPGLRLLLVGDRPTHAMRELAGPDDLVTGPVDTVRPWMVRATLVALPIRLGGGMRVKLTEAMAAGKAIVASPQAAAGLAVTDGEQLLLADSDEQFAAAIGRLLGDEELRMRLGPAAQGWAAANLSLEARIAAHEALHLSLVAKLRAGR